MKKIRMILLAACPALFCPVPGSMAQVRQGSVTVQVEENGELVEKTVSRHELNKARMARARELDAAKYAGERTTPLTPAEKEALAASAPKKRRWGKKAEENA